jgi:membrane protein DedA with SNARE-associated domain
LIAIDLPASARRARPTRRDPLPTRRQHDPPGAGRSCVTMTSVAGHTIHHLLHVYGCWLVFAAVALQALGAPLPGTTVLSAAALYAVTAHGLPIAGVIAAGALGAFAGTSAGYVIGRTGGERLIDAAARRLRRDPERLRAAGTSQATALIFVGRWVTGLRNVTGLLAGSTGMRARRFLPANAAAAVLWATVIGLEYDLFGQALESADTWLQILLVALGLAWLAASLWLIRRRALARLGPATR